MTKRAAYPTDLTDEQWALIEPLLPPAGEGGRPREVDLREVINGILYLVRGGISWRMLPHDLPPWGTVHFYYRQYRLDGTWTKLNEVLRAKARRRAKRRVAPSAAILDSQSVKTTRRGGPERGFDGGKKVKGRKRHILVDTNGLLLFVLVHAASLSEQAGARLLLAEVARAKAAGVGFWQRLRVVWIDSGYQAGVEFCAWVKSLLGWMMEVVHRPKAEGEQKARGFTLLPRRWVVERSFGWLDNSRRLSKDYEFLPRSSEAMVTIAMINVLLHRLAPESG